MHRFALGLVLALTLSAADWYQFRGPHGDGHADAKLPSEWGPRKNVTWRKEIPGLGWSSPVAVAGKIYLTTAVPQGGGYSLRALCLQAKTGAILWNKEVFQERPGAPRPHSKNSHASPTPVVENGNVYLHFGHLGTACLKASNGTKVWATQELTYKPVHGNGGSPIIAGNHLIFSIDGTDLQQVVALDKTTGKVAWKTPRNNSTGAKPFSFSTPLLIEVNGQSQVISAGSGTVVALEPKTGKEVWRATYGSGYSVVPKPVFANGLVYLSSGYDAPTVLAIRPDGKSDVTKTHVAFIVKKHAPRNASPLVVGNSLYLFADNGILSCVDAKTGVERWNERVGKAYSASPIYAGGLVFALDEVGTATVFKPGDSYDPVATNKLNEKSLASFGVDGNALLLRTEKALYRIEKK